MGLSNAERQRRYRERRRQEQQRRTEAVTEAVTAPVTRNAVTQSPDLGQRGRRLWQHVHDEGGELKPGELVLLEEACRAADRLDVIDRILRGDQESWMTFQAANEDGSVVRVVLTNALAEVRQQQTTLARLLAELRQSRSGAAQKPGGARRPPAAGRASTAGGEVVPGVADLTGRIASRRAQTAG